MALVLALAAGGWLLRKPIAGAALKQWCGARALSCSVDFQRLGPSALFLRDLEVAADPAHPLRIKELMLKFRWRGLAPTLDEIAINGASLPVRYGEMGWDAYGLEALVPERDLEGTRRPAGGPALPVTITGMDVVLETSAGVLTLQADAKGRFPEDLQVDIDAPPTLLIEGESEIDFMGAQVEMQVLDGTLRGQASLNLARGKIDGFQGYNAHLKVNLSQNSGRTDLTWTASADEVSFAGWAGVGVTSEGHLTARPLPSAAPVQLAEMIETLTTRTQLTTLSGPSGKSGAIMVAADIHNTEKGGAGPFAISINSLEYNGVEADAVSLAGDLALPMVNGVGLLQLVGALTVSGGNTSNLVEKTAGDLAAIPDPFSAYAKALQKSLKLGLDRFDLGLNFVFEAPSEEAWSLNVFRPTTLRGASGLTITVQPFGQQAWLSLGPESGRLAGSISLSGGGAPTLSTTLDAVDWAPGGVRHLRVRGLGLDRWTVNDQVLWANVDQFTAFETKDEQRFSLRGELGIAGRYGGLSLGDTAIFGDVEAARGPEGWRAQTGAQNCLGFRTDGASSGDLAIAATVLSFCPEEGRLLHQTPGGVIGRLHFEAVELPFRSREATGEVRLSDTVATWQVDALGFQATLLGQSLTIPLLLAQSEFKASGVQPKISVRTLPAAPLRIEAKLEAVRFEGDRIPARASTDQLTLKLDVMPEGLSGTGQATSIRISDLNSDPLYQPIIADLSADLANSRLSLDGPVRLVKSDLSIAEVEMDLDLTSLTGLARIETPPLRFAPGGIQPHDLSERLRGTLTQAQGGLTARVDIAIFEGRTVAKGNVTIDNLTLQTVALDEVQGLNGIIHFDDLFALTTLPGQVLTVQAINPGIPLSNGQIRFQLAGPETLKLEAATWPLAGGRLSIDPAEWTIGASRHLVTARADEVELSEIITLLNVSDIEATGTVSGNFPVILDGQDVLIRDAVLVVDENGGTLKYLGEVTEPAAQTNPYAEYAFNALKDFRFSIMELGVDGNLIDEVALRLAMTGYSPDVLSGAPFAFNISVTSKLAQLLASTNATTTRQWVTDAYISEREARARDTSDRPN